MGQSLQATIDANNAKLAADIDGMQTDLDAITKALQAAIPAVGTTVSQASVDAMSAQVARLDAMKSSMDALVPAGPAPGPSPTQDPTGHTPLDANDQTPNSPGGRNNFFLPDFVSGSPETA